MHIYKSTMAILDIWTTILSSYTFPPSRGPEAGMFPAPFLQHLHLSLCGEKIDHCLPFATLWHINTPMELGFVGIFISIRVGTDGGGRHPAWKEEVGCSPPTLPSRVMVQDGGMGVSPQPRPSPAHPALSLRSSPRRDSAACPVGGELNREPGGLGFPPPTCHRVC